LQLNHDLYCLATLPFTSTMPRVPSRKALEDMKRIDLQKLCKVSFTYSLRKAGGSNI
jgi:hypothetical protein